MSFTSFSALAGNRPVKLVTTPDPTSNASGSTGTDCGALEYKQWIIDHIEMCISTARAVDGDFPLQHMPSIEEMEFKSRRLIDENLLADIRVSHLDVDNPRNSLQATIDLTATSLANTDEKPMAQANDYVHTDPRSTQHHASWIEAKDGEQDFLRVYDMSDLAATLSAEPKDASPVSSRSSSGSFRSINQRRPSRPHREEHVKRSRITYDRNGGQTSEISLEALSMFATNEDQAQLVLQRLCQAFEKTALQTSPGAISAQETSDGSGAEETRDPSKESLTTWLLTRASKALFGE